jgi:hypothetical protein
MDGQLRLPSEQQSNYLTVDTDQYTYEFITFRLAQYTASTLSAHLLSSALWLGFVAQRFKIKATLS